MSGRVRVGMIDSGFDADDRHRTSVVATRRFVDSGDGLIGTAPAAADALGHGSAIGRILLDDNPAIELLVAQVFAGRHTCSTAQVAAALEWLVGCGAAVINLSVGIRRPDALLRSACERAAAGAILVGSAAARGAPAVPAAYPFCIAVSGDARCSKDQISWLGSATADFGAHPFAPEGSPPSGGASYAAARISARIARVLSRGAAVTDMRACLQMQCSYHGPERKGSHPAKDKSAAVAATGLQP